MNTERILEIIENNDKYYLLGFIQGIIANKEILKQENEELKKQLHEASLQIQELIEQDVECPSNCSKLKDLLKQQQEFIKYLENKKNKLIEEVSSTYEDDLGKIRFVNEDIFNEIIEIELKYKEIIGKDINVGSKGGNKDE